MNESSEVQKKLQNIAKDQAKTEQENIISRSKISTQLQTFNHFFSFIILQITLFNNWLRQIINKKLLEKRRKALLAFKQKIRKRKRYLQKLQNSI